MRTSTSIRWLAVAVSAVTLLVLIGACRGDVVEVPGETVVVEKEVIKTVEVPGQTVVKEVVKEVEVPGETVVVTKEVVREVEVPGQTVVKEVVKEVEVPGETVVVTKEIVREVEKPVIQTQVVIATPTPPPPGPGPAGEIRIADSDIAFPNMIPCKFAYNPQDNLHRWSIFDTVYYRGFDDPGISLIGLGESWSYNEDQTVLTWNIRRGVEYDGGWGEVTAEDWQWSWDSQHCEGSLHSNIFISGSYTKETKVIDDDTVEFHLTEPNVFYLDKFEGPGGGGSFTIFSKKKFDTLGEQKADRNLTGGTGPFKLISWSPGDSILTEARVDHYRKVPEYRNVRVVEIKEAATVVAALLAGEIDVAELPANEVGRARDAGIDVLKLTGDGTAEIITQGRFCFAPQGVPYATGDKAGEPVPDRPGYDPSKPWVLSCDPESEDWERARKVRNAIGLALDRQSILDNILAGFGRMPLKPGYMYGLALDTLGPIAKERGLDWEVRYDLDEARRLLAEAGFSDGFDVEMAVTTSHHPQAVEIGEAVATQLAQIGINVKIETLSYTGYRPSVVNRERNGWWLLATNGSAPSKVFPTVETWALRRNPEAAFNNGWEIPQAVTLSKAMEDCEDEQCLIDNRIAMYDWWAKDQGYVPVLRTWGAMGLNSEKIAEWPQPTGLGQTGNRFSTEYVQKPR